MSIQPGKYIIQSRKDSENFVGVGPVPLIYPPPDVPLRSLPSSMKVRSSIFPTYYSHLTRLQDVWEVKAVDGGELTFGSPRPQGYNIITKDNVHIFTKLA